ncbi:hypothetical protein [Rhizobium grahamii]|uniref:Uncharacterized protein n=2 Tax=Rhizobium grahamii TaxID=1120045 RepID=S3I5N5_9HYPH|nr:hypothetical protein [Rhizobium grahamii]EPE94843.1 hypothetical protein RGCCGE502_30093 [Rhizobium grahamii CCGE 502]RDJ05630.1 hypothetical protein B5K06_24550 [Rhizobium grahamii]
MGSEAFENLVASQLHISPDGSVFAGEMADDTQAAFANVPEKARGLVEQTIRDGKGWAAFGTKTNAENRLEVQVLYLLEDGDTCVTIQDNPERISPIYLPEAVSRSLLLFFRLSTDGDEVELRSRLQAFLTKTNENRSTSTAPRVVKGGKPRKIDSREYVRKWEGLFPAQMLESIARLQDACNSRNNGSEIDLSDKFVTGADLDGDRYEDWVANGYGVFCRGPDGGRRQFASDEHGATVWVMLSSNGKLGSVAEFRLAPGDTIRRYDGYVIIDSKLGIYSLKAGSTVNALKSIPEGGRIVFTLART